MVLTGCELTSRVRPARFSTDIGGCIDTSSDLLYHKNVCDAAMVLWLEHLGSLATDRWPLLSQASNYEFLKSKEWRCTQLASSRQLASNSDSGDGTGAGAEPENPPLDQAPAAASAGEASRLPEQRPTSAEKPPLDQNPAAGSAGDDSQLLEPSHKKARADHTPAAGEYQLMLAERSHNDAEEYVPMIAQQKDGHSHVVVRDTVSKKQIEHVPNGQEVRIFDVVGDSYLVECDSPKCKGLAKIHNFVQGD